MTVSDVTGGLDVNIVGGSITVRGSPRELRAESMDGAVTVDVHQVVHDASSGELLTDSRVKHRYRIEDGLIVRMDVLED